MNKTRLRTIATLKRLTAGILLWLAAAAAFSAQTVAAGLMELPSLGGGGDPEADVMDSWADFSTIDGLLAAGLSLAIIFRRRRQERLGNAKNGGFSADITVSRGGDSALIMR